MDAHLSTMLGALGLPQVAPEPEVAATMLSRIRARSLAHIVAGLINEHEPLLRAVASESSVTVTERGVRGQAMTISINEVHDL